MANPCPACGSESSPADRFCSRCGSALARACPRCGGAQPATAVFCSACGNPLEEGAPHPLGAHERQERRLVTVLFADLAGSTALAATLDPEDVRELQGELFELVAAQVAAYGGVTEKFVGDAILAVFGIPQTHGDDAERAVRAGLAALERFDDFAVRVRARHGAEVGLRVGVNTGDVVASREGAARGELIVSGDPVNVAARLQQAARPGEVLVGARTHAVTSRAISYGPPRDLEVKGKTGPVRAWAAVGTHEGAAPRSAPSLAAPLVGRDSELTLLHAIVARARDDAAPQLVTLFGQAGVGKSRLLAEFLDRLGPARFLRARCLPFGQGATYGALADAAKGHAGILATDGADVARRKLEAAVLPLLPGRPAEDAVEAIGWTAGLTSVESTTSAPDPAEIGRRLREAWVAYLSALGSDELCVLALEDVHWASSPLLDLVDEVAGALADSRLLLVCTARPELLETRPAWGAGKGNATALTIAPLSREHSEALVAALLGDSSVASALSQRVLATAEGNPFFVEEILQMLIERGALAQRDGVWALSGDDPGVLPDSVHGVVAARIDLLEEPARDALRRCSVVGRAFWPAAVDVDEHLMASLARRGLVSDRPRSAVAGSREFVFKHAVTREVAYSTLPRAERRRLHRRVAEWLEGVAPDRSLETVELAAYHYREAVAYGEEDPEIVRRTFELLLAAGNGAVSWAAFEVAHPHLERALELATTDLQRATAGLGLARLDFLDSDLESALRRLAAVERLLPQGAAELHADVLSWRSRVCWLLGRWAEALSSSNAAVEVLTGLGESPQLARALARRSQIEMLRDRPDAAEHAREAIAVAHRVGDGFAAVNAGINVFTAEAMRGVPPDPAEVLRLVDAARDEGSSEELHRAIVNFVWSAVGYLPVAEIEETVAASLGRAGGVLPSPTMGTYLELSIATMLQVPSGRWAEADASLASLPTPPGDATVRLVWLGIVAGLAFRRGARDVSEPLLEELRPLALASGETQRIVPMACVAIPSAVVSGDLELLRALAGDVLAAIDGRWSLVLSGLPIVRALAAANEMALLERYARSLEPQARGASSLQTTRRAARGLLALAGGRPLEAASLLAEAADRERTLGNVFHSACVDLDLARALEEAGDGSGAAAVRARATSVLAPLRCVNPF